MNIFLWILQSLLALLLIAGGGYKAASAGALHTQFPTLPSSAWLGLGVIEVIGGLLIVLPWALKWQPQLTSLAALVLCLEALGLSLVYARASLALSAENPLTFSVPMAVMLAIVAYGRTVRDVVGS
jgi:hypothetical protein